MSDNGVLTAKQTAFLLALVQGQKVEAAARSATISCRTATRFQKLPAFQAAMRAAQEAQVNKVVEGLYTQGLEMLRKHILADVGVTPASQVAAMRLMIDERHANKELAEIKEIAEACKIELERGGGYYS
ncbi:MAG TPA: hypothetical protein DDW33_14175 [Ktedonobacter sp.]|jgi:glutamine cyclotransferase|nr:hypothetical protein [Ktedonobacter sp.]HBE26819.1 hypothetical protein [Ktedonobacter sp.]HCF85835.1 hypothetical protein [Ktedonobacter sp.]HCP75758.1 hypothetical protein [Ktedonobacter sp.]